MKRVHFRSVAVPTKFGRSVVVHFAHFFIEIPTEKDLSSKVKFEKLFLKRLMNNILAAGIAIGKSIQNDNLPPAEGKIQREYSTSTG